MFGFIVFVLFGALLFVCQLIALNQKVPCKDYPLEGADLLFKIDGLEVRRVETSGGKFLVCKGLHSLSLVKEV